MWATWLFSTRSPDCSFSRYKGALHAGFAQDTAVPYNWRTVPSVGRACSIIVLPVPRAAVIRSLSETVPDLRSSR
ncbi:hypothetical protein GCM10010170_070020 [Dactylosporangium salmoneum]|uniref:Uncharacterized protein n=1 Tax=Dactylosporangium salmoneum TaxID=53361 RepID=A0ABP5U5D9_9ACTN